MDGMHFDSWARTVSSVLSRRTFGGVLTLGALALPSLIGAKNKKKRKKITRNSFGCVNVGKFCKNAGQCCSGICQGKKGEKKCRAHDSGGCTAAQDTCVDPANADCVTSAGGAGICTRTTGNAGFCTPVLFACIACTHDAECRQYCGPGAACIVCADQCAETGHTLCTGNGGNCSLGGAP
jgi:hypothetical protein